MNWARLYSDIFNPLIMNVVIVITTGILSGLNTAEILITGLAALLMLGFIPYWYLRQQINRHVIDDVDVKTRAQRLKPMLVTIGLYLLFAVGLAVFQPGGDTFLLFIILCFAFCAILATAITRYWKISLHNACFSATWMIILLQVWLGNYKVDTLLILVTAALLSILIMGLARVRLEVHTIPQVIGGVIYGLIMPVLLFYMFIIP